MDFVKFLCSLLGTLSLLSICQAVPGEMTYEGTEVLGNKGQFVLHWIYDPKTYLITFNISVLTTGWVGLGFSKDGTMKDADLVYAGVENYGRPYIQDMFADYNRKVLADKKQDWQLISASESGGYTYVQIARPVDTCDRYDYPITCDLVHVLWAYGETDQYDYHFDKRGSFRAYLLDPVILESDEDLQLFRVVATVTLPPQETSYQCSIHRAPELESKHQMVEFHPYMENQVAVGHTHHFLIWQCVAPPGMDSVEIFEPLLGLSEECYFNPAPVIPTQLCKVLVAGWAVGGKPYKLPNTLGVPLGESPNEYYMLETHYNNPEELPAITLTTGMDIYYTANLRPNDGEGFLVGYDVFGLFMVPPISTNFYVPGMCSEDCTKTIIPESGMEILAVTLHGHLSAKDMRLQQFRNGYELDVIKEDKNFDPTFQQVRLLYEPREVLPGDILLMLCEYDNTWTNVTVVNGFATREEMCIAVIYINKRIPYSACVSQVPHETLLPLIGVEEVEWNIETQERIIVAPPELAGQPLSYVTDFEVDWTKRLRYEIQETTQYSPHISMCPQILMPGGETFETVDHMKGVLIHEEANVEEILSLATGYGEETLMGNTTIPNRTPGPITSAIYPKINYGYGYRPSSYCSNPAPPPPPNTRYPPPPPPPPSPYRENYPPPPAPAGPYYPRVPRANGPYSIAQKTPPAYSPLMVPSPSYG